jgi:BirA family transcriptional regulator, biotin operon repressor / biotin---[acetyl-CoA-carboxylase] ligase
MKEEILKLFRNSAGDYLSGESLSTELGISRTAIWKYINILKSDGYTFEASSKVGYKLISTPDILNHQEINPYLSTDYLGNEIFYYDSISSTNTKAKELAGDGLKEGTLVIAEEQTAGKGRLGRNWLSPKFKGIWMSVILRPDLNPIEASKVTLIGAAAVYKAMEDFNIKAHIKWPNDIVLDGKKVCGILTEMSAELNKIHYLIMGIGINVNIGHDEFNEELRQSATSLKLHTGRSVDRKRLTASILNNLEKLYNEFRISGTIESSVEICRNNSILIGRDIKIINRNEEVHAAAIDIDNDGHLIVKHADGTTESIFSGEVSVRGINGYV